MKIITYLKMFLSDKRGNVATLFAVCLMMVAIGTGVAIDSNRHAYLKLKTQSYADASALAAGKYMTEASQDKTMTPKEKREEAREIVTAYFSILLDDDKHYGGETRVNFTNDTLTVHATVAGKPTISHLFGRKTLAVDVESTVNIGKMVVKDVDIALISDATGSMQVTLDAIQMNMKSFHDDVAAELKSRAIDIGEVRIKFLFYRDFMVDIDSRWTDPEMELLPGLEQFGPLYQSKFFSVPDDEEELDEYVDFFLAQGGGSARESAFEAIWYAMQDNDWGNGSDTVRAIILWTDAPNRPLGDTEEWGLTPVPAGSLDYWSSEYWEEHIGAFFVAMTKEEREDYTYNTFHPKAAPKTISQFRGQFETFHNQNVNGMTGLNSLTVNVIGDCLGLGYAGCGDWPTVAGWDGVDLYYEAGLFSDSETYNLIVKQTADAVEKQLVAKDLAIAK